MTGRILFAAPELCDYLSAVDSMKKSCRFPGKYKYTPEGFVLEHGRAQRRADSLPPDLTHGPMRECYGNSFARIERGRYIYTEGFAAGSALICQHAWLTDAETGEAIDVTWMVDNQREVVKAVEARGFCAYLGVAFRTDWLLDRVLEQNYYPSVIGNFEAAADTKKDCPLITGEATPDQFMWMRGVDD